MDHFLDLLRGARCLLGFSRLDVQKHLKMGDNSVHRLEAGKYKLLPKDAYDLKSYYEDKGVEFFDAFGKRGSGVRWKKPGNNDPFRGSLIRGARGLANLSINELGTLSGADRNFIFRLENEKMKALNQETFQLLETALKSRNVELIGESRSVGAGVRFISAASERVVDTASHKQPG